MALLIVLAGIFLRVMPHPDNFAPVTAIALFSGVVLSPAIALTVPLAVMIASDLIIGPHSLYWLTWGCFFLVTLMGMGIRSRATTSPHGGARPWLILFGTVGGSVLFFVATNLGVFFFQRMYPMNGAGLVECYVMALPFFRNSLIGDLFFSAVFFGAFAMAKRSSQNPAAVHGRNS